jgi:hypothetical protein
MENIIEELKDQKKARLRVKALHKASVELGSPDFLEGLGQAGGIARMEIVERAMVYYNQYLKEEFKSPN